MAIGSNPVGTAVHVQVRAYSVVRSYAVTFTFILLHVLNPLGIWTYFSESEYATAIVICTFPAILVPDIAFSWRELTLRRA